MRLSKKQYQQLKQQGKVKDEKPVKKTVKKEYRSEVERRYAERCEFRKLAGEIKDWKYEPLTFRLADDLKYIIDFLIVESDGSFTFIETKGAFIRREGLNKFKVAREMFPFFKFEMWQWDRGQWSLIYELSPVLCNSLPACIYCEDSGWVFPEVKCSKCNKDDAAMLQGVI